MESKYPFERALFVTVFDMIIEFTNADGVRLKK